jgi:tetratricopeptide (TPR) repeat protein
MDEKSSVEQVQALKEAGNRLFKAGLHKEAIKQYKQAISLQPSAALYTNKATALKKVGKLRDAIQDCDEALALDRCWVRAYIRKAEILIHLKEYEAAIATLTKGLKLVPTNEDMKELMQTARTMSYGKCVMADVSLVPPNFFSTSS